MIISYTTLIPKLGFLFVMNAAITEQNRTEKKLTHRMFVGRFRKIKSL